MFFAKCDEFYPHCYHRAIFGAFAPAGHRKTPPPLPNAFSNRAAITHRALNHSSFYRSYLKIRIFVRDQGVTENQPAGIHWYVEELRRGHNADIGRKDFFETASNL
jgi:hypothetical protein